MNKKIKDKIILQLVEIACLEAISIGLKYIKSLIQSNFVSVIKTDDSFLSDNILLENLQDWLFTINGFYEKVQKKKNESEISSIKAYRYICINGLYQIRYKNCLLVYHKFSKNIYKRESGSVSGNFASKKDFGNLYIIGTEKNRNIIFEEITGFLKKRTNEKLKLSEHTMRMYFNTANYNILRTFIANRKLDDIIGIDKELIKKEIDKFPIIQKECIKHSQPAILTMMINGKRGTGKTDLSKAIITHMHKTDMYRLTISSIVKEVLDLEYDEESTTTSIGIDCALVDILDYYCDPGSVIVIDDIDSLLQFDKINQNILKKILVSLIKEHLILDNTIILFNSRDYTKLPEPFNNKRFYSSFIETKEFDKEEAIEMCKYYGANAIEILKDTTFPVNPEKLKNKIVYGEK